MARFDSTRELIRSILKDDYFVPHVETYTITEDVGAGSPCRISVTLRHENHNPGATIEGEGVGSIDALCAGLLSTAIFWDIPAPILAAGALAQSLGFVRQRTLTRMAWGVNYPTHDPGLLYAVADLATG